MEIWEEKPSLWATSLEMALGMVGYMVIKWQISSGMYFQTKACRDKE